MPARFLKKIASSAPFFLLLLVFGVYSKAEKEKPVLYRWPLSINNGFSSAFLEFRPTHFHAGIDFRTFQKTGYPVFAIASGVIHQIRVDKRGAGRGLYLRHHDGRSSIYFHLERFIPPLEDLVVNRQAASGRKYFGLQQVNPPLEVKAGQVIAYSGETGSGFPHLHLEIRDASDAALNPFDLLSFPAPDRNPPRLENLVFRSRGPTLVDGRLGERVVPLQLRGKSYAPAWEPVVSGPVDLVLQAWDTADTGMRVAPRSVRLSLNGTPLFQLQADKVRRSDNIQSGLVFDLQRSRSGSYAYNLFYQPGYELEKLKSCQERIFQVLPLGRHLLEIEVIDFFGNLARAEVPFRKAAPDYHRSGGQVSFSSEGGQPNAPACRLFVNRDRLFVISEKTGLPPEQVKLRLKGGRSELFYTAEQSRDGFFFEVKLPGLLDGDRYALEFQTPAGLIPASAEASDLVLLLLGGIEKQRLQLDGFLAEFGPRAAREPRLLVARRVRVKSEFPLEAPAIELNPAYLPFLDTSTISFSASDGLARPIQVGIFKKSYMNDQWHYQHTVFDRNSRVFQSSLRSAGTYALLRDVYPPDIVFPEQVDRGRSELIVDISDRGKGIDDESLRVTLDGVLLDCEYDHDRRQVRLEGIEPAGERERVLVVSVSDLAGNTSTETRRIPPLIEVLRQETATSKQGTN